MQIKLSYGKNGLDISLPENTKLIEPHFIPKLPDEFNSIKKSIQQPVYGNPLIKSFTENDTVGISICDITRPMPIKKVLPAILEELSAVANQNIKIFIANGTHRPCTKSELIDMLGKNIFDAKYNIINHNAFNEKELTLVGNTRSQIPVFINSEWLRCDYKITIGLVEPHFFAGFSGGPKMIAPGLAGFKTIMQLHNSNMIESPNAIWGITEGNPIHDSIREIAKMSPSDFSIDVTVNKNNDITSVHSGEMFSAHKDAATFAYKSAMREVNEKFDIVITTNSGYPLDMNLYQTIKGISAASQIVKSNGSIICASECSDGFPEHGEYKKILESKNSPDELLTLIKDPNYEHQDQWQVQIQAQIMSLCSIYLKSDHLTHHEIKKAHLTPIDDIESKVKELIAITPESSICVLPEGPQTIPIIIK
jgi:nickel-dependent lactate racemase